MKTITNCTICSAVIIDSFTMVYPWCKDCGGDCNFYDPETIEESSVPVEDPLFAVMWEEFDDYMSELYPSSHFIMARLHEPCNLLLLKDYSWSN